MDVSVVVGKQAKTPRTEQESPICLKIDKKLVIDVDGKDSFSEFEESLIKSSNVGVLFKSILKLNKTIATVLLFGVISISLGFIELFQNQFSELFKELYTEHTFDHVSFSLMIVSIVVFVSIITFLPSAFKKETKDAEEIADKWFNRKKRAISKSKELSKILSTDGVNSIEIWLHSVDHESWFLAGFLKDVLSKSDIDSININIHQSDFQELSYWLTEQKIDFNKVIHSWENFSCDSEVEHCRSFINRILGENADVAWNSFISSTIAIGDKVYFSPSSFLDISANLGFNSEKILNAIQQDYRLFRHVDKINAPLFMTPFSLENYATLKIVEDVGITNILLSSKREQDPVTYYIAYVNTQDPTDKAKAINGIIKQTLDKELYSIFDSWLFSKKTSICLDEVLDYISYESVDDLIKLLKISARYEDIFKLLERLKVFNDPNHQVIKALCLERQGQYQDSFSAFSQVEEERLYAKNKHMFIQYLLDYAWAIVSSSKALEMEIELIQLFQKTESALYECYSIMPDQYWHFINNKATYYEKKENFESALEYHIKCLSLIGITSKWKSGSYINIAFNYRKLFEKNNDIRFIVEAKNNCIKGYEIKKELGDVDEIAVAVVNLAKIALLTDDQGFWTECEIMVKDSLELLNSSNSIKQKDELTELQKELVEKIGH